MEHPITRATFNLTRACNLACDYCFTQGCRPGVMSKDVAFRAVDFLFDNARRLEGKERHVEIGMWGGEPLIEWSLLQEIVLYAKEKSAAVAVPVNFGGTTNGTLLTPEKFDFLDEHRIFFMVSFDGTEDTHNYYRKFKDGRGSHSIILKNLKEVLKKWPMYRVRMGPIAQRIDHHFEDMKFIFDLGIDKIMFSPVYESGFTQENWDTFVEQGKQVVDYMVELVEAGRKPNVTHYSSYKQRDNSIYPCGAGRFYVGIDIDGAIYPCHRFNKFNDNRPWQEKEVCIGHITQGITRPLFRQKFIDFVSDCGNCPRKQDTPCHGGCYATNFDFTGQVNKHFEDECRYVEAQKKISTYLATKLPEQDNDKCGGHRGSCNPNPNANAGITLSVKERLILRSIIQDLNRRVTALEEKFNEQSGISSK